METKFTQSLVGRNAIINYNEAKLSFVIDANLKMHWLIENGDGTVVEGKDDVVYKQYGEYVYHIAYTDQNGVKVTQVMDAEAEVAKSVWMSGSGVKQSFSKFKLL